jgi:hypothetical protein
MEQVDEVEKEFMEEIHPKSQGKVSRGQEEVKS